MWRARRHPGCCAAIAGSCMGWRGVPMGGFWPVAERTMPSGCRTRPREPLCSSCGTPTTSTPASMAWRGVRMESFWPVRAISRGVHVWEVTTGTRRWVGRAQQTRIRRVAWSPDGTQLASGGGNRGSGELIVWEVPGGERLYAWSEPSAIVDAVVWSPTGAVLISGGSDGSMRWWDVQSGECLTMRQGHQGAVQSLRVSPDGSRLASCGDDDAISVWELESGEHLRTLRRDRPYERLDISGAKGLTDAQRATLRALGAIEDGRGAP